jgi:hypothetical protein
MGVKEGRAMIRLMVRDLFFTIGGSLKFHDLIDIYF